jgi:hypothetical protein
MAHRPLGAAGIGTAFRQIRDVQVRSENLQPVV